MRVDEAPGFLAREAVVFGFIGDERSVFPDGLAVLAPIGRQRPARQRLARIPLALAVMQQRAGGEPAREAPEQFAGQQALLGPKRR